jgi:hypothetical protein
MIHLLLPARGVFCFVFEFYRLAQPATRSVGPTATKERAPYDRITASALRFHPSAQPATEASLDQFSLEPLELGVGGFLVCSMSAE